MTARLVRAAVVCLALETILVAQHDPDEGTLASSRPRIAEPMVFDLIRPLGSKRGEVEVNSLFRVGAGPNRRDLLWAPEIEYSFLDGYGVEFELPLRNAHRESFKGALQGTLPGPWPKHFIHGWQGIIEKSRTGSQLDALYLAGVKLDYRWSVFTMTGVRREHGEHGEDPRPAFLGNYTLFYAKNDHLTYGLETNWKGAGLHGRNVLVMPQVQFRHHRINIQVGLGWMKHQNETSRLVAGWRISREF